MGSLFEWITDWIKEGLIDAITGQYTSIFNSVNNQVADVANQVGQTPQGWNGGVFSMIQNLSETVVIPIARMILTFVLVYELIQMILEKNNMHEFDTWKQVQMYCFWFFPRFRMVYLGAGACAVDHIALRGRRKHTDNHIWAFPAHFATLCSVLPSGHPSFYKCSILFLTQKPSFR